jgi:hypothetical protein
MKEGLLGGKLRLLSRTSQRRPGHNVARPPVLANAGDTVLWCWCMEGTHRGALDPPGFAPTARSMRVEGIDQWTMREGRIARYRAFYDLNDLARQLGIAPAPGSGAERAMVALQRLKARLSH